MFTPQKLIFSDRNHSQEVNFLVYYIYNVMRLVFNSVRLVFNLIEYKVFRVFFFLSTFFFLFMHMVLTSEDLSFIILAKYSIYSVELCKLITFHSLKSGELKHMLCFYLLTNHYKPFTK